MPFSDSPCAGEEAQALLIDILMQAASERLLHWFQTHGVWIALSKPTADLESQLTWEFDFAFGISRLNMP